MKRKGPAPTDPAPRFWAKVAKGDGCWEWTAGKAYGYGRFCVRHGHVMHAHRYSYELRFGEIPLGMNVLHRCDNPGCVRPSHLFLGRQLENVRDMMAKGRARFGAAEAQSRKECCVNGHPLAGENLWLDKKGWRHCIECRRKQGRDTERRRRERRRIHAENSHA